MCVYYLFLLRTLPPPPPVPLSPPPPPPIPPPPHLKACFDRERDGPEAFVSTLVHNNIRAMWHGIFSQDMADTFVRRHLMNTSEFWTQTPLPSISVADARFQNVEGNNWSGPPEGLTFQRAIRALENYGHHAEVVMIGARQKRALMTTMKFPQQINPFTSVPDGGNDCYGPMLLAMLEFSALTTGIAVRPESETILWSSLLSGKGSREGGEGGGEEAIGGGEAGNADEAGEAGEAVATFSYTQQLGGSTFRLDGWASNRTFIGLRNGAVMFECTGNARVVTGIDGIVVAVVGASASTESVVLRLPEVAPGDPLRMVVHPNEEWMIVGGGGATPSFSLARAVQFTAPHN